MSTGATRSWTSSTSQRMHDFAIVLAGEAMLVGAAKAADPPVGESRQAGSPKSAVLMAQRSPMRSIRRSISGAACSLARVGRRHARRDL